MPLLSELEYQLTAVAAQLTELIDDANEVAARVLPDWQPADTSLTPTRCANLVPKLIILNVSGVRFTVQKETLLRVEGSYFHSMLDEPSPRSKTYYLDLHAPTFDRVIIFLRTGKLSFGGLPPYQADELRRSFESLNLPLPIPDVDAILVAWHWDAYACSTRIAIDGPRATKGMDGGYASVMGTVPVSYFQVRLDRYDPFCCVGLQPRHRFLPDAPPAHRGYNIRLLDGYLSEGWSHPNEPPVRQTRRCDGITFAAGDLVAVRVTPTREIRFEKNGVDVGVAIAVVDPPSVVLYPVVTLFVCGTAVSIIAQDDPSQT
ncbi:Aste57867_1567 [Aphanomyces stellatus]|uniref:Aste57867_1567 protein n=1 Tax=Aphanomyces stellatus TaxID=120398 RepID=A0A485KAN2_9STRA|nr:hypothetical protein As57867_001566 [Aphanomyces stellatus]VFT78780.1 Aste57867_1567 [Aphanomyces stellatus]